MLLVLILWIQLKRPAEIRVEMDRTWHCSQIAGDVAVDRVGCERAEACAVDAGTRNGSIGRPVVKVSVAVVIRTGCDVVRNAITRIELGR